MKKLLFICFTIGIVGQIFGQGVSITSDGVEAHPSAMLEVRTPTTGLQMGILFPRVNLDSPFTTPIATHLFGVNTNTSYGTGINSGIGLYRYTGSKWSRLLESSDSTNFWGTKGNAGTDPSTHFIGTTDNKDLIFKANNVNRILVPASGIKDFQISGGRDIVIGVARALQLPAGNFNDPSLRFGSATANGISSPRNGSIAITYGSNGSNSKFFFDLKGLIITFDNHYPNEPQAGTQLDVEGSIYTRDQIVYSKNHNSGTHGEETGQDRTAEVKRYWSTSFSGTSQSGTSQSVPFYSEYRNIQFRILRAAADYFLEMRKFGTGNRNYVSSNLGSVTLTGLPDRWGSWKPVTSAMTSGAGVHHEILISSEQLTGGNNLGGLYKLTIFFNGNNGSTDYIRVLTEAYYNH